MENMIKIDELFVNLESKDDALRYDSFKKLLELTSAEVTWIYDYWQICVDKLTSKNSFHRSIGLMLIANLTLSDSENKFEEIIDTYLDFFNDEKFITSRQCLQNVWRVAVNKEVYKQRVVSALKDAYSKNIHLSRSENLIKQDIVFSLHKISKFYKDKDLSDYIDKLIAGENDKKIVKALLLAKASGA
jgi:hypothetical protein